MITSRAEVRPTVTCFCLRTPVVSNELLELLGPRGREMITSQVGGRPTVTCFCLHTPIVSNELLELLGPKGAGNDHLSGGGQAHCHLLLPTYTHI
jgi:hypothetical protein